MTTLWRLIRAQAHWTWLLPPLWMAGMLASSFYLHRPPATHAVQDLYSLFLYFLPLAGAVYLAGAPSFDREEGAAETHLGAPQPPALRLALLALPRLAAWAITVGTALLVVSLGYLPDQTWHLLELFGPPALALTGVALAGTAIARHQLGGALAALLWWTFDAVGRGTFNQRFFLFGAVLRTPYFPPEVQARNIALVGVAGLLLALATAHRRSWWIR